MEVIYLIDRPLPELYIFWLRSIVKNLDVSGIFPMALMFILTMLAVRCSKLCSTMSMFMHESSYVEWYLNTIRLVLDLCQQYKWILYITMILLQSFVQIIVMLNDMV